jgi:hypothetical protein
MLHLHSPHQSYPPHTTKLLTPRRLGPPLPPCTLTPFSLASLAATSAALCIASVANSLRYLYSHSLVESSNKKEVGGTNSALRERAAPDTVQRVSRALQGVGEERTTRIRINSEAKDLVDRVLCVGRSGGVGRDATSGGEWGTHRLEHGRF